MTKMIRELTANAWFTAMPTLQISTIYLWLFSDTSHHTAIDYGIAVTLGIGMLILGAAVLGTFALGVRALIVD